jgi:hypothetical protein
MMENLMVGTLKSARDSNQQAPITSGLAMAWQSRLAKTGGCGGVWTKSATMSLQYQRSDEPHARRAGAGSDMSNVVRFKKPTPIQPHASAGRHEVIASIAALPAR